MELLHDAPPRLREYVEILEILSTNRDLNLNIEEELEMLTIDLEKLPSYRIGERRGLEKGLEQGLEQGVRDKALALAVELLGIGMAPQQISLITELPLEDIHVLKQGNMDA